jgi:hypothetical protein
MDLLVPELEMDRELLMPGGLFSAGKRMSKVSRMCKIIGHSDSMQLRDSTEEAYQFEDLSGEYDTDSLWVNAREYQHIRHNHFLRNVEEHREFLLDLEQYVLHLPEDEEEKEEEGSASEEEMEEEEDLQQAENDGHARPFMKDKSLRSKVYNNFAPVSEFTDNRGAVHRTWLYIKTRREVKQTKVCQARNKA